MYKIYFFFFFNNPATPEIYTLPLHDALPIGSERDRRRVRPAAAERRDVEGRRHALESRNENDATFVERSEEHTSELQSRQYLVCRLLLEKKNNPAFLSRVTLSATNRTALNSC